MDLLPAHVCVAKAMVDTARLMELERLHPSAYPKGLMFSAIYSWSPTSTSSSPLHPPSRNGNNQEKKNCICTEYADFPGCYFSLNNTVEQLFT